MTAWITGALLGTMVLGSVAACNDAAPLGRSRNLEPGGAGEIRPDGSLAMKFPFWRGEGAKGQLVIEGRSLDRPGLGMTGSITRGYGEEGLQATALVFPEPGCSEVTALAGGRASPS